MRRASESPAGGWKRSRITMGSVTLPDSTLRIVAAFSRHDDALDWGRGQAEAAWGPIALASPWYEFRETRYYEATMGADIKKCFWAFEQLMDPADLPASKLSSNAWEAEFADLGWHAESRPLNLDPGYITRAKLVLASTKDHAHRVYLGQGIFAEVTLVYQNHRWQCRDWTFPDYRREDYQLFFLECREYYRRRLAK